MGWWIFLSSNNQAGNEYFNVGGGSDVTVSGFAFESVTRFESNLRVKLPSSAETDESVRLNGETNYFCIRANARNSLLINRLISDLEIAIEPTHFVDHPSVVLFPRVKSRPISLA